MVTCRPSMPPLALIWLTQLWTLVIAGPEEMAFGPLSGIPNPMTMEPFAEPDPDADPAEPTLVAPVLELTLVVPVPELDFDDELQPSARSVTAATTATIAA
jgi:hypothetical protein